MVVSAGSATSVVARGYTPLLPSGPYGGKGTVAGAGVSSGPVRFAGSTESGTPPATVHVIKCALVGLAMAVVTAGSASVSPHGFNSG